jgi:Initiator Replication protein
LKKEKAKIQHRRPKGAIRKGLPESLPTFVQKSCFMLGGRERNLLNHALEKYRPGRSEPILVGGAKALKPALQLMNVYRLRIDAIKGGAVVTSYTRWLEAVIVKGTENQEVYVTFSPQFERIWLESKKSLPEYVAKEPANIGLRSQYSIRLYSWAKKYASVGKKLISLEELRKVLGLESVKDAEGKVIQEPPLPVWANFRQRALDTARQSSRPGCGSKAMLGAVFRTALGTSPRRRELPFPRRETNSSKYMSVFDTLIS